MQDMLMFGYVVQSCVELDQFESIASLLVLYHPGSRFLLGPQSCIHSDIYSLLSADWLLPGVTCHTLQLFMGGSVTMPWHACSTREARPTCPQDKHYQGSEGRDTDQSWAVRLSSTTIPKPALKA